MQALPASLPCTHAGMTGRSAAGIAEVARACLGPFWAVLSDMALACNTAGEPGLAAAAEEHCTCARAPMSSVRSRHMAAHSRCTGLMVASLVVAGDILVGSGSQGESNGMPCHAMPCARSMACFDIYRCFNNSKFSTWLQTACWAPGAETAPRPLLCCALWSCCRCCASGGRTDNEHASDAAACCFPAHSSCSAWP